MHNALLRPQRVFALKQPCDRRHASRLACPPAIAAVGSPTHVGGRRKDRRTGGLRSRLAGHAKRDWAAVRLPIGGGDLADLTRVAERGSIPDR